MLRQLWLTAIADRAEAMLALGRHSELGRELASVVAVEPLWERLRWLWMLTLYRCGNSRMALKSYEDYRVLMAEQSGLDPGPDLSALAERMAAGDPTLDLSVPPESTSGPTMRPAELPHEVAGFVGRTEELEALEQLSSQRRAVVISAIDGAAGIGKTALAIHFGHRVAEWFPDGQLHLNLNGFDPVRPPMEVAEALRLLLRGVGVEAKSVPFGVEERAALFRSTVAGRRMLVVLDNAVSSEQVRGLLPGGAESLVVVTSRRRLGGLVVRDGAQRVTLGVLGEQESVELITRMIGLDRVAAEPEAVRELAALCGHLPLALRIAGERVAADPHTAVADAVIELRGVPLDVLATEDDEVTAVRAALSWSYLTLKPGAARLFRLLGLHPGLDISTAAAAELCGQPERATRRLLDELAGLHLIEATGKDRYRFHDLVRLYVAERSLDEPETERDTCVRRELDWYLHHAYYAGSMLTPSRAGAFDTRPWITRPPVEYDSQAGALAWLDAERGNLMAAVRKAVEIGDDLLAARLPLCLSTFFQINKQWSDWAAIAELSIAASRRLGNVEYEAKGHNLLSISLFDRGDLEAGLEHAYKALGLDEEIGYVRGQARQLSNIGAACSRLGRFEEALEALNRSLKMSEELDDQFQIGMVLSNMADASVRMGQIEDAVEQAERGVQAAAGLNNPFDEAYSRTVLGAALAARGDHRATTDSYRRAIVLRRAVCDPFGEALALCGLAESLRDTGNADAARALAWNAYLILDRLGAREAEQAKALASA